MKKVKEILAILLVLALTFTFAACSNSKPSPGGSDSDQADTSSKPSEEKKVQGISDTLPEFDKSGTIQETHLADVYGVSITATGLSYTNSAVKLSLKLENNSDAKREAYAGTTGYGCNSVNGYMIHDGYMWCQLDPGAVEEEEISFSYAELYFHGINKIAEIGIGFDVSDDDFNHEHSDMIIVKTQIADSYNYNEDTYLKTMKGNSLQNAYGITVDALSENTAYSEGNVCLISQAIVTNKDGSSKLMLEFDNKAEQAFNVRLSNLKLNGEEVKDSYVASDLIWSEKKDVLSVSLDDYIKENESLSAKAINSVEVSISLTNTDGMSMTQESTVVIEF